ncbi:MAG TPA: hypothetical protein VGC74_15855 [Stenotrophomonas sp.]|jgi:hypothetical protein
MPDEVVDLERRLLAAAVFELRALLSGYIDRDNPSPEATAALFAYALHNEALAVLEGRPVDVARALEAIDNLAPRLGDAYVKHFRDLVLK